MAGASQKFAVDMEFDVNTSEIKQANAELGKMKKAADKNKGAFASLGSIVGGLGIASLFGDLVRRVGESSESAFQFKTAYGEAVGLLTNELEPVISLVTRGLSGMLSVMIGLVRFIKTGLIGAVTVLADIVAGNFAGAMENANKAWSKGSDQLLHQMGVAAERAAGISKASELVQSKIILEETKIRLRDATLSGDEKVKIIKEKETEALAALRASGEFMQANRTKQAFKELEIRKEFSTEREAADREVLTQRENAATVEIELLKAKLEQEGLALEGRLELQQELFERENDQIVKQGEKLLQSTETIGQRLEANRIRHLGRLAKAEAAATTSEKGELGKRNDQREQDLANHTGITEARLSSVVNAAAQELALNRDALGAARAFGAEAVRIAAAAASKKLIVKGIEAAGSVFASTQGGIYARIAAAAAVGIYYAGLAVAVGAAGNVAANALAPPAPSPTGSFTDPVNVTTPLVDDTTGRVIDGTAEPVELGGAIGGRAAGDGALQGGTTVTVNVATLGQVDETAAREIGKITAQAIADAK